MEINQFVMKLLTNIKNLSEIDFFMGKGKFTQTEFRLLLEVFLEEEKGGNIISTELARRLGITRSAISQLVTKLEERDVVKRTASPTDKKIAYIKLSEKALAFLEEQNVRANRVMKEVEEEFGEERMNFMLAEYEAFSAVYARVRKRLSEKEEKK